MSYAQDKLFSVNFLLIHKIYFTNKISNDFLMNKAKSMNVKYIQK